MSRFKLLPEYGEVRLVCCQSQHDEIGISTIETMMSVGVVVRLTSLVTNEIHDLMFTLSRDVGIRQDHLETPCIQRKCELIPRSSFNIHTWQQYSTVMYMYAVHVHVHVCCTHTPTCTHTVYLNSHTQKASERRSTLVPEEVGREFRGMLILAISVMYLFC